MRIVDIGERFGIDEHLNNLGIAAHTIMSVLIVAQEVKKRQV